MIHIRPLPPALGDEKKHIPIQKRIFHETITSQKLEQLNNRENPETPINFCLTLIGLNQCQTVQHITLFEELLVKLHDILTRHKFDIRINHEFHVVLRQNGESPAYSENQATALHFEEKLTLELALLRKYGIKTSLTYREDANPNFAQKGTKRQSSPSQGFAKN